MSIESFIPFPYTEIQFIQACTRHPAKIVDVKDPTGSGRVRVECPSLWGKSKSNWILYTGNAIGGPRESGGKNTGDWSPAVVGQYVMVEAPGGNVTKWTAGPGGASMFDKGNPGDKRG